MPRNALRCTVELDIHSVSCPGVYLPRRDPIYLSVSLFKNYRRTTLATPNFPLLFHEKFRFDKVFFTAYQPQQVADQLDHDSVRIELVQISDVHTCGVLLAYFEANARDFIYPYPDYSIPYGPADRQILMERTIHYPGIAPKLEFSTKAILTEVNRAVPDEYTLYSNYMPARPRSAYSPRRRSHSRHRSPHKKVGGKKNKCLSYHHRRPTLASISHCRSVSPDLHHSFNNMALYDSRTDDEDKPPFVVRKVTEDLIGRSPGDKRPCRHRARSRSLSRSRARSGSRLASYYGDDYLVLGRSVDYSPKVARRYADISSSSDSDALSDVSEPSPRSYPALTYRRALSPHTYRRSSARAGRKSLKDRFEQEAVLGYTIQKKVDDAIKRNRSRERTRSREKARSLRSLSAAAARLSDAYDEDEDEDFAKIRALEKDLEISRNRSLVHVNNGEYWTEKAAKYQGKTPHQMFNSNLKKTHDNLYNSYKKKFDDRTY